MGNKLSLRRSFGSGAACFGGGCFRPSQSGPSFAASAAAIRGIGTTDPCVAASPAEGGCPGASMWDADRPDVKSGEDAQAFRCVPGSETGPGTSSEEKLDKEALKTGSGPRGPPGCSPGGTPESESPPKSAANAPSNLSTGSEVVEEGGGEGDDLLKVDVTSEEAQEQIARFNEETEELQRQGVVAAQKLFYKRLEHQSMKERLEHLKAQLPEAVRRANAVRGQEAIARAKRQALEGRLKLEQRLLRETDRSISHDSRLLEEARRQAEATQRAVQLVWDCVVAAHVRNTRKTSWTINATLKDEVWRTQKLVNGLRTRQEGKERFVAEVRGYLRDATARREWLSVRIAEMDKERNPLAERNRVLREAVEKMRAARDKAVETEAERKKKVLELNSMRRELERRLEGGKRAWEESQSAKNVAREALVSALRERLHAARSIRRERLLQTSELEEVTVAGSGTDAS